MYNIRNRDPSMVKLSHTSLSSTSHVTIDKQTKKRRVFHETCTAFMGTYLDHHHVHVVQIPQ